MFISAINFCPTTPNVSQKTSFFTMKKPQTDYLQNDAFVKNDKLSFGADTKAQKTSNLIDNLSAIGIVGAPFLLSIAAATYLAKHQNPEQIFLSDGTYLMDTNELSIKSSKIKADGDDGVFDVNNTGIKIDAQKYDYADISNGIYKNYDGSVDIDLKNNKYIDVINGIFIDPENKISAVEIDGKLTNIVIPSFGSGYPTCPWDPRWNDSYLIGSPEQYRQENIPVTRKEYEEIFGYKPENDPHGIQAKGGIVPEKSLFTKIKEFFTGKSSSQYDIYGRKIFNYTDINGDCHNISLSDETSALLDKHNIPADSIPEVAHFIENLKLSRYITDIHPDFSHMLTPHIGSIEEFIANASHSGVGDAIIENTGGDITSDGDSSFNPADLWNDFKEMIGG